MLADASLDFQTCESRLNDRWYHQLDEIVDSGSYGSEYIIDVDGDGDAEDEADGDNIPIIVKGHFQGKYSKRRERASRI